MKTALVCGAGGFIGSHMVKRLKAEGYYVRGVDVKLPEFAESEADEFDLGDLRDQGVVDMLFWRDWDEVYQLAADMGGAGFVFTGVNDADILRNNALINLLVLDAACRDNVGKVFFSSSACIYPARNQVDPLCPNCAEETAYPADPDSDYGFEKLFSERLYLAYARNRKMDVHIARYHNIFGPEGTWDGGREKAPAALCRKVAQAPDGGSIEIWGPGNQTRSFLYIDECVEGTRRLVESTFAGPVNIGSEEMIAINDLARMAIDISGKRLDIINVPGPVGVAGRNSDNRMLLGALGWAPSQPLRAGMEATYAWIAEQVAKRV